MNLDDANAWTNLIGKLGFPIAVSAYLLIRFEKKIEADGVDPGADRQI